MEFNSLDHDYSTLTVLLAFAPIIIGIFAMLFEVWNSTERDNRAAQHYDDDA